MKQVFTSQDRIYLYHIKNLLEAEGIECVVKNENLSSLAGEIPMTTTWLELWVIDSLFAIKAEEIIANSTKALPNEENWVCKQCGEEHSSQFTECWNCQSTKAF